MNISLKCCLCDKWSQVVDGSKYCPFCGKEHVFNVNGAVDRLKKCVEKRQKMTVWALLILFGPWIGFCLLFSLLGFKNGIIVFVLPMILGSFFSLCFMKIVESKEKLAFPDLYSNPSLRIN